MTCEYDGKHMKKYKYERVFEATQHNFYQNSQPEDVIVVSRRFEACLDPDLLARPWYQKKNGTLYLGTMKKGITSEMLRNAEFLLTCWGEAWPLRTKADLAACKRFLATLSVRLICARKVGDESFYVFVPIMLLKRCWMSAARVAWMAAVIRGI